MSEPPTHHLKPATLSFSFPAPVLRQPDGMRFHYLPIPDDLADAWQAAGVRRLVGTMNGRPVDRGIQGRKDGERYLVIGLAVLKQHGLTYGDIAHLDLRPHPNPDAVDVPEELAEALAQDPEAAERFYSMTPGKQRGLAGYVDSAKRLDTRVKRALDLAHKLRTYTLYGDGA